MDRPDPRPSPDESWDDVALDDDFVGSAAFTEAPGLERIARARWSAHKEPLAEKPSGVPVIGVSARHPRLASRLTGAVLATAFVVVGGYAALRGPHTTPPGTALVMGADGGSTAPAHDGQSGTTQSNAARPGTSVDDYTAPVAHKGPAERADVDREARAVAPASDADGQAPASPDPTALPLSTSLAIAANPTPAAGVSATPGPATSVSPVPTPSGAPPTTPSPTPSATGSPSSPSPTPAVAHTPATRFRVG